MIAESADRYEVDLVGARVLRCAIDYAFNVDLDRGGAFVTVRIEAPFEARRGGEEWEINPVAHPEGLGPLLGLARTTVSSTTVFKDGSLAIAFADGTMLHVSSTDEFEAWTLTVTGGPMIVAGPGPRVSVFPPSDRPETPNG